VTILILGLCLFLGIHSLGFLAPAWRERQVARLGLTAWQGIAGLIGLTGFILIIWGYGLARIQPIPLYAPPIWSRHLSLLIMLPVFPLLLATYLPGRIQSAVVHPMLTAVIIWALAHLTANGNLADLLLFGGFLAWSLTDRITLLFRQAPTIQAAPPHKANDLLAIGIGLTLYVVFLLWAHKWLFGVSPLGTT